MAPASRMHGRRRAHHTARLFIILCGTAAFALSARALHAQQERPRLTLSGFLGGSLFLQDATFAPGNGQQALYVADDADWWHGGDVRNARVTARLDGAPMGGAWYAAATLEIDFFGPFNGTGNFADEMPLPRLRLAHAPLVERAVQSGPRMGAQPHRLAGWRRPARTCRRPAAGERPVRFLTGYATLLTHPEPHAC